MDLEQAKVGFHTSGNESAVLACIFKDPSCYYEVQSKLSDTDFLTPHHRALWVIVRTLVRQGVPSLDTAAILTEASSKGLADKIGGYDYVNALFEKTIDPANLGFYISRLSDASTKLKIIQAINELSERVDKNKILSADTLSAEAIVDEAQHRFLAISLEKQRAEEAINIADGIERLLEDIQSNPSGLRGVSTGFSRLDDRINGLEAGTLTVVGARPKVGKSTVLLNWAKQIAYVQGVPTLYIDTEMSLREQSGRLLSMLSGVPERTIKDGSYRKDDQHVQYVEEAREIVKSGLILHKYFPDFTADSLSSLVRKYHHQYGVACFIFDYIKLPGEDLALLGNVKEHQSLGFLCVALKNIAGELGIPVVTAAQIGRGGANKGRVTAADFADSDRILRYANTLLGLSVKTKEDMTQAEDKFGRELARKMGTHRLQILNTRGGGEDYNGLDIYFRREILTMSEASEQSSDHQKDEGGEDVE